MCQLFFRWHKPKALGCRALPSPPGAVRCADALLRHGAHSERDS